MSTNCEMCGDTIIDLESGLIEHETNGYCLYDDIDPLERKANGDYVDILKALPTKNLKEKFMKIMTQNIENEKKIFSLEKELENKSKKIKNSETMRNIYKKTIIQERRNVSVQQHNFEASKWITEGGLNKSINNYIESLSYDFPNQVELTHTDTSWKPKGAGFGKNLDYQYYIIIPISDNINTTAQKKGYNINWIKILENDINHVLEFGHTGDGWDKLPTGIPKIKLDININLHDDVSFLEKDNNVLTITCLEGTKELVKISLNYARVMALNRLSLVSDWNCYRYNKV